MMIKYYKDIKCKCGNFVHPYFYELYFDMTDGEIFENCTDDIVCDKCGAAYRLVDIKFIPKFKRNPKTPRPEEIYKQAMTKVKEEKER